MPHIPQSASTVMSRWQRAAIKGINNHHSESAILEQIPYLQAFIQPVVVIFTNSYGGKMLKNIPTIRFQP
jgi:hypothetical protein